MNSREKKDDISIKRIRIGIYSLINFIFGQANLVTYFLTLMSAFFSFLQSKNLHFKSIKSITRGTWENLITEKKKTYRVSHAIFLRRQHKNYVNCHYKIFITTAFNEASTSIGFLRFCLGIFFVWLLVLILFFYCQYYQTLNILLYLYSCLPFQYRTIVVIIVVIRRNIAL